MMLLECDWKALFLLSIDISEFKLNYRVIIIMKEDNNIEVLRVEQISKSFQSVRALKKVSFSLYQHEILGIIGENGAGKSTLLNILSGVIFKDEGKVILRGKPINFKNYREASEAGISRVFQELALIPTIPIYENLLMAHEDKFINKYGVLNKKMMIEVARKELDFMEIKEDPENILGNVSYDVRKMIEITRAFTISNLLETHEPVILVDEPTVSLNINEANQILSKIKKLKKSASFIFVSHRMQEIFSICDRVIVLKDGFISGEFNITKVNEEKLHEKMVGRKKDVDYYKVLSQAEPGDQEVLRVKDFAKNGFFRNVTFGLKKSEILGVGGLIGSSKSELSKAIIGAIPIDKGELELRGKVFSGKDINPNLLTKNGLAYLSKDRIGEGIILNEPISWNITAGCLDRLSKHGFILDLKKEREMSLDFVNKFRIRTPSISTLAANLSGGNQQKVIFSRLLANQSEILILDNPTAGVDVGAKGEIYNFLREFTKRDRSILLITDDLPELIYLSSRIIIMKDGEIVKEIDAPKSRKPEEIHIVKYMS